MMQKPVLCQTPGADRGPKVKLHSFFHLKQLWPNKLIFSVTSPTQSFFKNRLGGACGNPILIHNPAGVQFPATQAQKHHQRRTLASPHSHQQLTAKHPEQSHPWNGHRLSMCISGFCQKTPEPQQLQQEPPFLIDVQSS